jgi:POT family proton-dependent oligopeptide transporter
MSLWFLTSASAQAINAQIVKFYKPETEILYFGIIGGIAVLLGVLMLLLSPKIQSYMKGVR